jgi:hypothetical protein
MFEGELLQQFNEGEVDLEKLKLAMKHITGSNMFYETG